MINTAQITPGQAISRINLLLKGNAALREQARQKDKKVPTQLAIYLEGEPGVGKSAVPKQLAEKLGYYMEDIRANQMSPDDAGGVRMPDPTTGQTVWYPPNWMPDPNGKVIKDGKEYKGTILFFDELASADDRVRKPLFGIFLDRVMNGRHLPDNCIVMAAGNEADTGTMVFELDNATRTRFITLRIIADFESWQREFAPYADVSPTTVSYLKSNVHHFCMTEEAVKKGMDLYGNPRSWEHVSIAEKSIMQTKADRENPECRSALADMISGKVGIELSMSYMAVFDIVTKMSTLFDILQVMKKGETEKLAQMWPKEISQLYALTYSMMSYPNDIDSAEKIYELMDYFPESSKTDMPFNEMKPAIMEVITKKLRQLGTSDKDMKRLSAKNSEMVDDVIEGPLIEISFD